MDIFGDNLVLDILKWVGIVFVAGFIGYFGRYLGMLIIEKMRKDKPQREPTIEFIGQGDNLEESKLKLEKKKAKAEAKRAKKEGK